MNGLVSGGWGYVIAAYGLSALILGGYVVRTVWARRKAKGERRK